MSGRTDSTIGTAVPGAGIAAGGRAHRIRGPAGFAPVTRGMDMDTACIRATGGEEDTTGTAMTADKLRLRCFPFRYLE